MPDLSQFDVRADKAGELPDSAKYKSCYWRKPDGYIIVAPAHPDAFSAYSKQEWTALTKYGEFRDRWENHNELGKLESLFRQGGAKEFGLDQILVSGWHRKAPFGVVFPQLEGVVHADVLCPTCRKAFISRENLQSHEQIAHRALSSNNQLARAISDAQGAPTADLASAMAMLMETQATLMERLATQDSKFMALIERMAPAAPAARK